MKVARDVDIIEVRERNNNERRARLATKPMYDCRGRLLACGRDLCDCLRQVFALCCGAGEELVSVVKMW